MRPAAVQTTVHGSLSPILMETRMLSSASRSVYLSQIYFLDLYLLFCIQLQTFVDPKLIDQVAYILIALGAFIFIISFLGYCGSIKESRGLLTAYAIFIFIIFCLEVMVMISNDKLDLESIGSSLGIQFSEN